MSVRELCLDVDGWTVRKSGRTAGVQGEGNATALVISFDPTWDAMAKKLTWWDAKGLNPVVRTLTADMLVDLAGDIRTYRVPIPPEPLEFPGECTVVIDGYRDGVRARTVSVGLTVKFAPVADNAGEPADPTPSQAEQLQKQIDTLLGDISEQAGIAQEGARVATEQAGVATGKAGEAKASAELAAASQAAAAGSEARAAQSAARASVSEQNAAESAERAVASEHSASTSAQTAEKAAAETARLVEGFTTDEAARVEAERLRQANEHRREADAGALRVWEAFDPEREYLPLNKVSFEGRSYECQAPCSGILPTDERYWLLIADKGRDGAVIDLEWGVFAMSVNEAGHLLVMVNTEEAAPPLRIDPGTGHLLYEIAM